MRKFSSLTLSGLALALAMATAPAAMAQQAGEYTVGVGAHVVSPKSDNGKGTGPLAGHTFDVHTDEKPTLTFEYFIADHMGIEVLAALPFQHNFGTRALGVVGETKVLPPTVSVQYHFDMGNGIKPFAGVGLNYTTFLSTSSTYSLKDSVGAAVHLGTDIALNDQTSFRVDARWIDISSDLKSGGVNVGKVEIDPIVLGFAFVHKF